MFVVGLTGGIGSGKSAASRQFEQLGIDIVDADIASRTVVKPGTMALQSIAEHFGNDILLPDSSLDRAKLRQCIFNSPEKKQWLESLLHPLIREQIERELKSSKSPYVVFASPLLIEAQQDNFCDRLLVIDVPEAVQIQRTIERDNNDEAQVRKIIASQTSREKRLEKADDVIENTLGLQELKQQVNKFHQHYLSIALAQASE